MVFKLDYINKTKIGPAVFWMIFSFLFLRLILFTAKYFVNILYWDQWDFIFNITASGSVIDWFTQQHGPHRQGIGGVIQGIIYPLFNWNITVELYSVLFFMLISCLLALMLKRKLFGNITLLDLVIPLAYFSLIPFETYLGALNISHAVLPLFLVTSSAYLFTVSSILLRNTLLFVITFLSIFTGFAIFSGVIVVIILIFLLIISSNKKERIINFLTLLLVIFSFAAFLINYQNMPAVNCFEFPHSKPFEYIEFSVLQFGKAFEVSMIPNTPGLSVVKYILVSILFVALFSICVVYFFKLLNKKTNKNIVLFYLSSFTVLFIVFTSIGRVCLGVRASLASRYVMYAIPGILSIYFALIAFVQRPKTNKSNIIRIVLTLFTILIVSKEVVVYFERPSWERLSNGKSKWIESYLQTGDIIESDSLSGFKVYPSAKSIHNKILFLEKEKLNFFTKDISVNK